MRASSAVRKPGPTEAREMRSISVDAAVPAAILHADARGCESMPADARDVGAEDVVLHVEIRSVPKARNE